MNCPKCEGKLEPMGTREGVELDFCMSCKGILFDQGEVAEYFELGRDIPDFDAVVKGARPTDIPCPKCGTSWLEMPYAAAGNLLIELCPGCGVVWLDKGEFPKLEALAAQVGSPNSKLMRAVKGVERRGFQVLGFRRG